MEDVDRSKAPQHCNPTGSVNRKWLIGFSAVVLIGGIAFNWSWLVAAGVAPLLVGILPCVAMCALHLCSKKNTAGGPDHSQHRPAPGGVVTDR